MSRLRPRDDSGAYAILYGLLMLTVLGMAALVVDLGALRQNRRDTRLAADAGATAGARQLDMRGGTANPRQACLDAWSYLGTNLGITFSSGATGCSTFPTSVPSCPATASEAVGTVDRFTIKITWPVPNTSTLLTQPDVKPAATGVTNQAVDPVVDGTNPCERLAVQVQETEDPAFAGVFGAGSVSTVVTSVARATSNPGSGGPIAALNVLEQTRCNAIDTGGQGSIEISNVGTRPGIIAVESSGRDTGGSCPPSRPYVVNAAITGSGGHVWANGAATPANLTGKGLGQILAYAMNTSPTGNPTGAYDRAAVTAGVLLPAPTVMAQRFGQTPVTDFYNCTAPPCADGGGPYVNNLVAAYGAAGTPGSYSASPAPYNTAAFVTLGTAVNATYGWPGCTVASGSVYLPPGNYYINCDTLTIRGNLVFGGGNVVVKGKAGADAISVGSSGCFAVNVPLALAGCPVLNLAGTLLTPGAKESILFIRAGNFTKGAQASVFTERTFVYMGGGHVDLGGGNTGKLYMTSPQTYTAPCATICQNARFGRLALWNASTDTQSIGGQVGLTLHGVLFVPNADFVYTGAGLVAQTNAQFWAKTIRLSGQGTLRMAPDPNTSIPRPELATALIR